MNKTALLIGASGLIGAELLKLLLESDFYSSVTVLVRKTIDLTHPKLTQVQIDFKKNDLSQFKVDHVFCSLGTTIKKAVSKDAFRWVDELLPLKMARASFKNESELFAIVTAMGANSNSSFFYNRVKGDVEKSLKEIGYKHLGIFRPSMLLGDRKESRLGEQVGQILMKPLSFLIPKNYRAIHVKSVANSILHYAERPSKGLSIFLSGDMLD